MRITLSCHRLCTVQGRATGGCSRVGSSVVSTSRFGAQPSLSPCPRSAPRRQLLTLPDLSKLSPFRSSSGGPRGDDDCETYHEKVTLSFPKSLLFDIVKNVDEYQSFVPYCVQSDVDKTSVRSIDKDTREFMADLAIGYGQLRESYTSRVVIVEGKSVRATAMPTPLFERLETVWSFCAQTDQTTEVDLKIHYAFANPFYAAFARTAIEKMTSQMIEAFKKRAEERRQAEQ